MKKMIKKLLCKLGYHGGLYGYKMHHTGEKIVCQCIWCGENFDVKDVFRNR